MKWRPKLLPRREFSAIRTNSILDEYNLSTKVEEPFSVENSSAPQPVTVDDNIPLPEGLANAELYKIYTTTPLRGVKVGTTELADTVIVEGEKYTVVRSKKWSAGLLDHYEVYLAKNPNW
jgi:hypothetical protein